MSVQKKRISKRRTRNRRSHHALKVPNVTTCPKCKNPVKPHYACPSCGYYRGKKVLDLAAKVERKLKARTNKSAASTAATKKKEDKNTVKKKATGKAAPVAEKKGSTNRKVGS